MDDSHYILPPPPPKPDFANRIKLKHRYSELKAQFHQITNLRNALEAELADKESKESKLRMECNLILDQIELIRTRLPPKTEPEPSEPDLKRLRRHHDKSGGFLYESDDQLAFDDTDAESDEDEDAEGEGEREEDEEADFGDGREPGEHEEGDEEAEGEEEEEEEEEEEDGHSAAEAKPLIHPAASL